MKHPILKQINKNGHATKGWGPFRYDWYSICSAHQQIDLNCKRCQCGTWINNWKHSINYYLFEKELNFWRWWTNILLNRKK